MSEHFQVGDHVWANFGAGKVLAHVTEGAHQNAQHETKYGVQNPATGKSEEIGYREPEDDDDHGSGGTFWAIK